MFDPSVGRWLGEDPKGFSSGDTDLYRYTDNIPTNATDPSGLAAAPSGVSIITDPGKLVKLPSDTANERENGGGIVVDGKKAYVEVRTGVRFVTVGTNDMEADLAVGLITSGGGLPKLPLSWSLYGSKTYLSGISIGYYGPNADMVAPLQFVWGELSVTTNDGQKVRVGIAQPVNTQTGPLRITTDKVPQWMVESNTDTPEVRKEFTMRGHHVDVGDVKQDIFLGLLTSGGSYPAPMASLLGRTKQVVMVDAPTPSRILHNYVEALKKNENAFKKVMKVEFAMHFATFLIYKGKSIYEVQWDSTSEWDSTTKQVSVSSIEPTKVVGKPYGGLSETLKKALVTDKGEKYKNQTLVDLK